MSVGVVEFSQPAYDSGINRHRVVDQPSLLPVGDSQTSTVARMFEREFPLVRFRRRSNREADSPWRSDPEDVQQVVVIIHAPSPIIGNREFSLMFHSPFERIDLPIGAVVVAHGRDSALEENLHDFILEWIVQSEERRQAGAVPIVFCDPRGLDKLPPELHQVMLGIASQMPTTDVLSVPLFVEPAGGKVRAATLVDRAVSRRFPNSDTGLKAFAAEAKSVLEEVLGVWSLDSAMSWLRSANGHLGGSRPVEVLALEGPHAVVKAVEASEWGAFA